jgi:ABC-type multidrug transport system ATPase subunit
MSEGHIIASDTPAALKAQLGNTVIEIGLASDDEALRAERLITQATGLKADREGTVLRVSSADGTRVLLETVRALNDNDLKPETLAVREPSLDDVFLSLTGKHTATDETDAAVKTSGGRR